MTDNQDPMAALQDLLQQQGQGAGSNGEDKVAIAKEAALKAQEEEAQRLAQEKADQEKFQALSEEKAKQEAAQIAAMRENFSTEINTSPAYQEAQAQKASKDEEKKKADLEERSRRIIQLKRVD